MVDTFQLSAQKRETSRTTRRELRAGKRVLGVMYGYEVDPVTVSLDASEMLRTYRKAGQSSLVDLDLDGKKIKVIIKALQLHPVHSTIQHVDFFAVNLKEKTIVEVPIIFVGESPAVKTLGGIFTSIRDSLEIRCLPTEIPREITVDISKIENIGDTITVRELGIDTEKYEIMHTEPEKVVCLVTGREEEVEEEVPVEEEIAEDEVPTGEAGEEAKEGGTEKTEEKTKEKSE